MRVLTKYPKNSQMDSDDKKILEAETSSRMPKNVRQDCHIVSGKLYDLIGHYELYAIFIKSLRIEAKETLIKYYGQQCWDSWDEAFRNKRIKRFIQNKKSHFTPVDHMRDFLKMQMAFVESLSEEKIMELIEVAE